MHDFPMRIAAFITALALAGAAQALEPISPSEFRDYAEGYTLYFERDGKPFGAESFGEGGETQWRFQDGSCVRGAWRPHGAQLCFFYGPGTEVQCWRMLRDGDAMIAKLLGDGEGAGMELHITGRDKRPLLCGEPGTEL